MPVVTGPLAPQAPSAGPLAGKVIVVSGGGRGQGAAETRLLTAFGAHVTALDLDEAPAEDLAGGGYQQLDVTDAAGWEALAVTLRDRYGRVDGLVANAGVVSYARLDALDPDELARVCQVNVTGTLLGIQALSPLMTTGGSIVLVGSTAALTGFFAAGYTASKWALRGLAKTACLELGPQGIRVNIIHPGYIDTRLTATAPPEIHAANLAEIPLGRTGTVADIAPLVAFLIGDDSSYISGAEIPIDGGHMAHGGMKSVSDAALALRARAMANASGNPAA
jgi:NAD(P)-dependent dehydrogenase (short-subunit alcohol dehydrogenase family)